MREARGFFERFENLLATLPEDERRSAIVPSQRWPRISDDDASRERVPRESRVRAPEMAPRGWSRSAVHAGLAHAGPEPPEHVPKCLGVSSQRRAIGYGRGRPGSARFKSDGSIDARRGASPSRLIGPTREPRRRALAFLGRQMRTTKRVIRALVSNVPER
jgi:hypothetical protein